MVNGISIGGLSWDAEPGVCMEKGVQNSKLLHAPGSGGQGFPRLYLTNFAV